MSFPCPDPVNPSPPLKSCRIRWLANGGGGEKKLKMPWVNSTLPGLPRRAKWRLGRVYTMHTEGARVGRVYPPILVHSLGLREDGLAVLDDELDRRVLDVHVCHFSFNVVVAHDGGREDDGEVFGRHLVLLIIVTAAGTAVLTKFSGSRLATRER